ncbi:hypothetical protein P0O15_05025 [Methanotrichaceae archaeon Mx]|uniref:Uncharacterized protein n=1 Tax=Candidatus Methanocrinis natronophilus TaxID=3033396 RepID=A0ABT5X763_9EURY|nr:hypothetical protein [Candidatus Methanocrinis natronophilus]
MLGSQNREHKNAGLYRQADLIELSEEVPAAELEGVVDVDVGQIDDQGPGLSLVEPGQNLHQPLPLIVSTPPGSMRASCSS